MDFNLVSPYTPRGDQATAIEQLVDGLKEGEKHQVLLGVTGSGKTFTMAKIVERLNRPTLVLAHNKTLAAQLYQEFRSFFPNNAVEYFVSYYDYYQPEAYIAATDTYIEKESTINDEIDRMRLSATRSLFERRDVLIVASVSCIYGLGSPEAYYGMLLLLEPGQRISRRDILSKLVEILYERNDIDFKRGSFRVHGDTIEVHPTYENIGYRIELWGDDVEKISTFDPLTGDEIRLLERLTIYPKTHFVMPRPRLEQAVETVRDELKGWESLLEGQGRLLEAQRIHQRTLFDMEMIKEIGYCHGIENYSRHLTGRLPGQPPPTLLDYLPQDSLMFIDESHQTVPQLRGMYHGDRSRKENLVEYGFRLPSAMDNRPLTFEEFEKRTNQLIYVSATPGPYELTKVGGAEYYTEVGVRCRYLHSEVETLERIKILRALRKGEFDVLIGINLLREGLDLPEVSLVAILDADKEGFLRSADSLIQTIGRAARHLEGKAILYADIQTDSMKRAIGETNRRREIQEKYNLENNITPESIIKPVDMTLVAIAEADYSRLPEETPSEPETMDPEKMAEAIKKLEDEMREAARKFEFERAAQLRDKARALRAKLVEAN